MKRTGIVIILLFLIVMSCKKESEMYSFFRQTNEQNLKTLSDGEFYSWAAVDSAVLRADYFLFVAGEITSYGDTIYSVGHCWSSSSDNPSLDNGASFIRKDLGANKIMPDSVTYSFQSYLEELTPATPYNVRSFAIYLNENGDTVVGYNPTVTIISTLPAINEWFEEESPNKPNAGARWDALSFNMGDTIFFGSGDNGSNLLSDIRIYDPSTKEWETDNFISLREPHNSDYEEMVFSSTMTNGIGFALTYRPEDILGNPSFKDVTAVFIGLGEHEDDKKSGVLIRYLLDDNGRWDGTSINSSPYFSGRVSGTVSFTIGSLAYIGTGSHSSAIEAWYRYNPAKDFRGNDSHEAWTQIPTDRAPSTKRVGAIAFSANGKGYFGLGKDINGNFLNDFWKFTPETNPLDNNVGAWEQVADFPGEPRQNAVAFVVGGQGFVGTGDNIIGDMEGAYTGSTFSNVYRYDPFDDKWTATWTADDPEVGVRDYTLAKEGNIFNSNFENPKKVTRACGFSGATLDIGFIGYGIMPDADPRRQGDYWKYQPWKGGTVQK